MPKIGPNHSIYARMHVFLAQMYTGYYNTYSALTFYAHRYRACPISSVTYPIGISIQAVSIVTSVHCSSSIRSIAIATKQLSLHSVI